MSFLCNTNFRLVLASLVPNLEKHHDLKLEIQYTESEKIQKSVPGKANKSSLMLRIQLNPIAKSHTIEVPIGNWGILAVLARIHCNNIRLSCNNEMNSAVSRHLGAIHVLTNSLRKRHAAL
jgi:hypothetical protein